MLIFGHTGITLGIATLLNGAVTKGYSPSAKRNKPGKQYNHNAKTLPAHDSPSTIRTFSFTSLGTRLDIRLLLIGSLLPDIIDKPVGQFFFRETLSNGRIFGHTLLFLVLITIAGYYLYRKREKIWLLTLSLGTLIHLILDYMWLTPKTLLWPIYGLAFERKDLTYLMHRILQALLTDPSAYVPEIVGFMILAAFMAVLVRRKKVYPFTRSGQV